MTISLRNLDLEVERAILNKSQRDGVSLNKAANQLLALALNSKKRSTDFDEFAGTWNIEAATEFDNALASMRSVELDEWKP